MLQIKHVDCGYRNKCIVNNINLTVDKPEILCVLGPNGVGKTTFYKTILGFIPKLKGEIMVDHIQMEKYKRQELSKKIAYVPQASRIVFNFSVQEVILMGRTSYGDAFGIPKKEDMKIVKLAIDQLGLQDLEDMNYNHLSGGQQQLVLIARAIVQSADLLIMDEPTSNLDYGNQLRVLEVIGKLRDQGKSIVMTTHSPEHALIYGDKAVVFFDGKISHMDKPANIITDELIRKIYNIPSHVTLAASNIMPNL